MRVLVSYIIIGFYALILAPFRRLLTILTNSATPNCGDGGASGNNEECAIRRFFSQRLGICKRSCSDVAVARMMEERRRKIKGDKTSGGARIAVIGGGIAGAGAAWSLSRAIREARCASDTNRRNSSENDHQNVPNSPLGSAFVHLYERRPILGGNAKTHVWEIAEVEEVDLVGSRVNKTATVVNTKAPASSSFSSAVAPSILSSASPTDSQAGHHQQKDALAHYKVVDTVRTGLSVLAWPPMYFKTYESLLASLGIPTEEVTPKFFVATEAEGSDCEDDETVVPPAVPQFRQGSANPKWAVDMQRWDRAVAAIRHINRLCTLVDGILWAIGGVIARGVFGLLGKGSSSSRPPAVGCSVSAAGSAPALDRPSFYEVCLWNPLNVVTARFFMCRIFGVSREFWGTVAVPIYSSSFLTTKLDALPAMIIPALDDIISVGSADPLKSLHTWREGSNVVFNTMAKDILFSRLDSSKEEKTSAEKTEGSISEIANLRDNEIILGADISAVEWSATEKEWTITYTCKTKDEAPPSSSSSSPHSREARRKYDYVIFACPSEAINIVTDTPINHDSGYRSRLFDALIPNITYENERDVNFTVGHIHCDGKALPHGGLGEELLAKRYTNYVEVAAAATRGAGAKGQRQKVGRRYGPVATSDAVENIFLLSTWVPSAVEAAKRHLGGDAITLAPTPSNCFKMMVTYNPAPSRRGLFANVPHGSQFVKRAHTDNHDVKKNNVGGSSDRADDGILRTETAKRIVLESKSKNVNTSSSSPIDSTSHKCPSSSSCSSTIALVDNTWAHPQLDLPNMLRSQALTMLQGRCNAYYCGSYATPGNGHDLSLLSGLVIVDEVIRAIDSATPVGGSYPFSAEVVKAGAYEDFVRLRNLMLRSL